MAVARNVAALEGEMVYLMMNWVLSVVALLATAVFVPGFRVTDFGSALIASGVVGLASALLCTGMRHVRGGFALLMSGVFLAIFDAFLFRLAGLLVPGFAMRGFMPAFAGAAALLAVSIVTLKYYPAVRNVLEWEPSPDTSHEPPRELRHDSIASRVR